MILPAWLQALPDAEQVRATDRWAIEDLKIPSLDLMERAGDGLARLAYEVGAGGPVAIVCGRGSNGGDGYVAARRLRSQRVDVRVFHVGALDDVGGDARVNVERLRGDPPAAFEAGALNGAAVVIDAVLGTGSAGRLREEVTAAVRAMNAGAAPVVAADVPTGVDATTGEVGGEAVRATATATFAAAKPGLWVNPGKAYAGRVVVVDIGIPPGAPARPTAGLIGAGTLAGRAGRDALATKFASGHVLVAGGSRGLTGAVCLASVAAMRAGAGYVTACVPASLEPIFEAKLTEPMTLAVAERDGAHVAAGADAVLAAAARAGALVLGPGLGRSAGAREFARAVLAGAEVPVVLDADGLNAYAGDLAAIALRAAPTVLTPHAGELARLLGTDLAAVSARRVEHARAAAAASRAVVVLKGDDTLVVAPDGTLAINTTGTPALASAGTGDVLAGLLGALLARGMGVFTATCAAVRVHGLAGGLAADRAGWPEGVLAGDVASALPRALAAEIVGSRP